MMDSTKTRLLTPVRRLLTGAALLALLLPAAARAGAPAGLRQHVEQALSAIETVPSHAALLRMHPDVDQTLREIVSSPSARPLARSRALTVLRHFPSAATRATLKLAIDQCLRVTRGQTRPSVELLDLQQAMVSYAMTTGPTALAVVQPQLTHWNDEVRSAAVVAVRLTRSDSALPLLQARLKLERSSTVKVRLGQQIEVLRKDRAAAAGGIK